MAERNEIESIKIREAWRAFIVDAAPQYWMTLTFSRPLSDTEAIRAVEFYLRAFVRLAPRKIRGRLKFIIGAERTVAPKFNETLHFHIVIVGMDDGFIEPMVWLTNTCIRCANRLRSLVGRKLCDAKNVECDRIRSLESVANYMVKCVRFPSDALGQNLWLYDERGLVGGTIAPAERYLGGH